MPTNVGIEPASLDAAGQADAAFYAEVNVACYPPDADFLVQSRARPEKVITYREYVRLRDVFNRTQPSFAEVRAWPALSAGTK